MFISIVLKLKGVVYRARRSSIVLLTLTWRSHRLFGCKLASKLILLLFFGPFYKIFCYLTDLLAWLNWKFCDEMGLTISSLFTRLFGKKQMRILMGKVLWFPNYPFLLFTFKHWNSWVGCCWQNHDPLQAETGWNCDHHPDHRLQCRDGGIQKHLLHGVGCRRPGQN